MRKITRYISIFIISFILLLTALSINNVFWVSASPEWDTTFIVHTPFNYWVGPVQEYSFWELLDYLIFYRVLTVWNNLRDILSAVIVGLLVMSSVMIADRIKLQKRD